MMLGMAPVTSAHRTPVYSNMAFQLFGYAVENITEQPFTNLVEEQLIKPLNLTRTFLTNPTNDTDAVVVNGWTDELGDEAP